MISAHRSMVLLGAALTLSVAACHSGGHDATSDTVAAAATSSTEPASTTAAPTTEADTTVPATEAATTTPVTEAATTTSATLPATTATAAATTAGRRAEYAPVAAPTAPAKSAAVPASQIEDGETLDGPLPDGIYFGTLDGFRDAPTPGISIDTTQLLTGADCEAYAKQTGQECDDDYLVKNDPEGIYIIDAVPGLKIAVAAVDGPGRSYSISYDELRRLNDGSPPAAGAPAGFTFTPFPFLYTVKNGKVTSVEQLWQP